MMHALRTVALVLSAILVPAAFLFVLLHVPDVPVGDGAWRGFLLGCIVGAAITFAAVNGDAKRHPRDPR